MRIGLNIRGQLLVIILLVLFGFSIQYASGIASQSNLQYISEEKSSYLDRDGNFVDQLNSLVQDTQNVISSRLEGLIYSLISTQAPTSRELLRDYRTSYSNLVFSARRRNDVGYALDPVELVEVSTILTVDESFLNELSEIIDTSSNGIEERLFTKQDIINDVIGDVLFDKDRIVDAYYLNSTIYASKSDIFLNDINQINDDLVLLNDAVNLNGDPNYRSSVQNLIIKIQQSASFLLENFARVEQDWISTEFNSTNTLTQSINTFSFNGNQLLTTISDYLISLDDLISLSQDQTLLDDVILSSSELSNSFTETNNVIGDLLILRIDIEQFDDSVLISVMSNLVKDLNQIKSIYDEEHKIFLQKFNELEAAVRLDVQSLNLVVGGIIGIIVFIIMLPLLWNISRSIFRLRKDIGLAMEGSFVFQRRKSYPRNELGTIESNFHELMDIIQEIVRLGQDSSSRLAGISEELAAGTEEAAASINDVASTISEFSAGSSEQNLMLSRVRDNLITHLGVVEQISQQIDETAKFVLKIAKRTNILGLNASIEAAKAGRFGLGFNVVAEEVRRLSDDSRDSAAQIAKSIEEIEINIRRTVEDILNEVNIVGEVAENTAAGSEEANASTSEQVIMMNEITETSAQLSQISQTLNQILSRFVVEVK